MASGFKSKAQMEKFKELVAAGRMTQEVFDECLALTPNIDELADRIHPKKEETHE